MKVGTDGIMLGAWAEIGQATHILDMGTGTGLLALMAAQRNPRARIVGLEIDPKAVRQARNNVTNSSWSDRIEIMEADILTYETSELFDAILCNPPFFQRGLSSPDLQRSRARHGTELTFEILLQKVSQFLSPNGLFSVVLPADTEPLFIELAKEVSLFPQRSLSIRSRPFKSIRRCLLQLGEKKGPILEEELCIHADHDNMYSLAYQELTAGFYL